MEISISKRPCNHNSANFFDESGQLFLRRKKYRPLSVLIKQSEPFNRGVVTTLNNQIKNMATIVVTIKPIVTGKRFLLASSNGSTPQIAAAGISAQGTKVPPPTQIAAI